MKIKDFLKPIHIVSTEEAMILRNNLLVAYNLRACAKKTTFKSLKNGYLKEAKYRENEYKALKRKLSGYFCVGL